MTGCELGKAGSREDPNKFKKAFPAGCPGLDTWKITAAEGRYELSRDGVRAPGLMAQWLQIVLLWLGQWSYKSQLSIARESLDMDDRLRGRSA